MDDNLDGIISRRSFLRRGACASLGMAGLASQMFNMRMVQAALLDTNPTDYRAAVCVFLFGGNDSGNTLVPYDGHDQDLAFYQQSRQELALTASQVQNTIISPVNTAGRRFAVHPAMSDMATLFESGNASFVANVGTLIEPVTKAQYEAKSRSLPSQLFAHNTQQEQWQISTADAVERIGWGGRVADALHACGVNQDASVSMNMSISGTNFFLSGRQVQPYVLSRNGPKDLDVHRLANNTTEREAIARAYSDIVALQQAPGFAGGSQLRKAYADIAARAIVSAETVDAALALPSGLTTPVPDTNLAGQLAMVARLIEQAQTGLQHSRQIFFVSIGGFDNHDGLIGSNAIDGQHAARLAEVNGGLKYFWDALGEIGMRDKVTTFTASDFGRTYQSNGDGSDHAWGGDHIIMGGNQLNGRRIFGQYPDVTIDGPQDTGRGRFIPTTAVDEYSFEIARWLGVPESEMSTVFPNLHRFLDVQNPATHLGMLV